MRRLASTIPIAVAGIVAGVLAKVADESTIGWASDLGTFPAIWILAIAVIGRLAPGGGLAAVRAAVFFLTMTAAYYAWSALVLGFPLDRWVATWATLALTAVPILASATWWATHRGGLVPGIFLAALGGAALASGSIFRVWLWSTGQVPPDFPVRPVQAGVDAIAAGVIAGLLPVHGRTRAWALVLTPAAAIIAGQALDQVLGRLFG